MIIKFEKKAEKQLRKLPASIIKKLHKQLDFLIDNEQHPSLRIKRMKSLDRWEGRIDYHYRFTFKKDEEQYIILTVGMHDEGLVKK